MGDRQPTRNQVAIPSCKAYGYGLKAEIITQNFTLVCSSVVGVVKAFNHLELLIGTTVQKPYTVHSNTR